MLVTPAGTWTLPLQLSVSIGSPAAVVRDGRAPSPEATMPEGLFGRPARPAEDVFARTAGQFSLSALAHEGFSWPTALDGVLASELAYRQAAVVRRIARAQWGFETCTPIAARGTECFVASTPEAVLVAFRGTQEITDWLINLNAAWTRAPYGHVHRGFRAAFQTVRSQLEEALADAGAERKRVTLTGHSLGGALATIAAAEWHGRFSVSGIYTFGQPAVGFTNFRSFLDVRYRRAFHRFVNEDDVVPRVPPGYRHVGRLFHLRGGDCIGRERLAEAALLGDTPTLSPEEFAELKVRLHAARAQAPAAMNESVRSNVVQEGLFPSVADHSLDRYVEQIVRQVSC